MSKKQNLIKVLRKAADKIGSRDDELVESVEFCLGLGGSAEDIAIELMGSVFTDRQLDTPEADAAYKKVKKILRGHERKIETEVVGYETDDVDFEEYDDDDYYERGST